ncbi:hypothetical protein RJZ90_006613 [Blastomyces dermatitidis]
MDDILVVVVVFMFSGLAGCLMQSASLGLGKHSKDIKSIDARADAFKVRYKNLELASIATIARLTYVHHGYNQVDFLYVNTEIMIWSMVEIGVSIIAISAVTLKPLLMKYKMFFSSPQGSNHNHNYNNNAAHERGRIYGGRDSDFTYTIGSGPPRRNRASTHGIISASRLRPDQAVARGQSSSEENIWVPKGDGHTMPSRDGPEDDLELIPRGGQIHKIHKVVEFSTSRGTTEESSQHISEHNRYTEQV